MERIKTLDRYQKIILLLLSAMLVIFTAAYAVVSSRVGFSYRDTILRAQVVDATTVYSGRIRGETTTFTVTQDKVVTYCYGDKQCKHVSCNVFPCPLYFCGKAWYRHHKCLWRCLTI